MTRKLSAILAAVLCICLMTAATAETISFDGKVAVKDTVEVYAPIGGTVESVGYAAGETVTANDALVTLKTNKVYATEDGTVTGVFGQPGDSAESISSRYGAVLYVEGNSKYTLSASTENAYNATANKYVHVGEKVYLISRSDSNHKGEGVITKVEGTSYTVEVTSGTFEISESCSIYRKSSRVDTSRIGRGTVARVNPVAMTGSGSIVSINVKDGDKVKRGQLLFETLTGDFDGLYMSGSTITAGVDGVVGSINASKGSALQKDSVVAVIYPTGNMRIEGTVAETDLSSIKVGDQVKIEMNWNSDNGELLDGTVTMISSVATSSAANGTASTDTTATYTVYIDFTPDANTRYGMTCVVNTVDPEEDAQDADADADEDADVDADAEQENAAPEGFSFPEGMTPPEGMTLPDGVSFPEGFTPPTGAAQ